jgi:hypothetical protein
LRGSLPNFIFNGQKGRVKHGIFEEYYYCFSHYSREQAENDVRAKMCLAPLKAKPDSCEERGAYKKDVSPVQVPA